MSRLCRSSCLHLAAGGHLESFEHLKWEEESGRSPLRVVSHLHPRGQSASIETQSSPKEIS